MLRESLRWSSALLGLFGLLNVGRTFAGDVDHNLWWIDLRWLPGPLAAALLVGGCAGLVAGALLAYHAAARRVAVASCLVLAACAAVNCIVFWVLLANGRIGADVPLPLSAVLTAILIAGAWSYARPVGVSARRRAVAAVPALVFAAAFPLLQTAFFGLTNYARPAEAIVVFGARVYADGTPSDALSDRVREGARLYHAGFAPCLLMSGGPGDGATSEPQAMQRLAVSLGVPARAITQDPRGLNSAATLQACSDLGMKHVITVSHFYHLPRIKLLASQVGVEAYTVPSPQGRPLRALPVFVAREVAAWWWYYAKV